MDNLDFETAMKMLESFKNPISTLNMYNTLKTTHTQRVVNILSDVLDSKTELNSEIKLLIKNEFEKEYNDKIMKGI